MVEENKDYPLLKESDFYFERDLKGEFIPQKVFVKELNRNIVITPIPEEEWVKLINSSVEGVLTSQVQDLAIIEKHLIEPKVDIEELKKAGKHILISKIVQAILDFSAKTVDN